MIITLAVRTLFAHPVRTAVLAAGFGLGVSVMAILLGVGQVVLEQARAPQLVGGGDVLIRGQGEHIAAARVLLGGVLSTPPLGSSVRAASPWSRASLYLLGSEADAESQSPKPKAQGLEARSAVLAVRARGGIPSLERALDDRETAGVVAWVDAPGDAAWTHPEPGDVLRAIDRFHPVPDVPARASSWAEWLYFNGHAGDARFYLTFLVGPARGDTRRAAGVRLQLDRGNGMETFAAGAVIDAEAVERAPDLSIAGNHVRVDGLRYRITLDLPGSRGRRATGELIIESSPGRLLPPIEIHGAGGWRTGYVVPVMAGALSGSLVSGIGIQNENRVDFAGGRGYHDHNWGFWEGVSWQWGQVQHGDTSFVFGRVFPPPDAADPARMPGFLGALGPDGPIGYASNATIEEASDASGRPQRLVVRGRSESLDLMLIFAVESAVVTRLDSGPLAQRMDFLQMRGRYDVSGRAGEQTLKFTAPGAAETFRGR